MKSFSETAPDLRRSVKGQNSFNINFDFESPLSLKSIYPNECNVKPSPIKICNLTAPDYSVAIDVPSTIAERGSPSPLRTNKSTLDENSTFESFVETRRPSQCSYINADIPTFRKPRCRSRMIIWIPLIILACLIVMAVIAIVLYMVVFKNKKSPVETSFISAESPRLLVFPTNSTTVETTTTKKAFEPTIIPDIILLLNKSFEIANQTTTEKTVLAPMIGKVPSKIPVVNVSTVTPVHVTSQPTGIKVNPTLVTEPTLVTSSLTQSSLPRIDAGPKLTTLSPKEILDGLEKFGNVLNNIERKVNSLDKKPRATGLLALLQIPGPLKKFR